MSVKKYLLISFLIFILSFPSIAEKKQKPLPLSELQNPKGPSYVPIPYPKNREEIIIDLLYAVEYLYGSKEKTRYYGNPGSEREILPKLLGAKPELHVGKIITAANRTFLRAEKYFVMDILDPSGVVAARVSLEDSGLFAGAGFATDGFSISPLMSLSDTRDFFAESQISKLAGTKIEYIEYEHFSGTSPKDPFLKIKTDKGIFYMDTRSAVYEFLEKKKFSSEKEHRDFRKEMFEKYEVHHLRKSFDGMLLNSRTLEVFFLKVVE
jgi:hypothetical protein